MKRLIIGGLAALAIATGLASPARADHCPGQACHEFDWATPYGLALENHGLGYLIERYDIPIFLAAQNVCLGQPFGTGVEWMNDYLTPTQIEQVANAMYADVCPEMAP